MRDLQGGLVPGAQSLSAAFRSVGTSCDCTQANVAAMAWRGRLPRRYYDALVDRVREPAPWRTKEEAAILRALIRDRGQAYVNQYAELILEQARACGDLAPTDRRLGVELKSTDQFPGEYGARANKGNRTSKRIILRKNLAKLAVPRIGRTRSGGRSVALAPITYATEIDCEARPNTRG